MPLASRLGNHFTAEFNVYSPKSFAPKIEYWFGAVNRQMIVKYFEIRAKRERVRNRKFSYTGRSVYDYQFHDRPPYNRVAAFCTADVCPELADRYNAVQ